MNPLTRCRVLGCQNLSVKETHGAASDEHGLFEDVDPVMLDRPELDDDFTPAADLKVVS